MASGKKVGLAAILIICTLGCMAIFVLSLTDVGDVDEDPITKIHLPGKQGAMSVCNMSPWKEHRPIRLMFNMTTGQKVVLQCAWAKENTIIRTVSSCLLTLIGALMTFFVIKGSKRPLVYMMSVFLGLGALALGVSMVIDSNSVRIANDWCNGDLKGVSWVGLAPHCDMSLLIWTCVGDGLGFALLLATAYLTFKYLKITKNAPKGEYQSQEDYHGYEPPLMDGEQQGAAESSV